MNKKTNATLFVLGLLIFSYTVTRAYLLSFTWDESFSYLQFARNGVFFPHEYNTMDANNHLLNTWLNFYLTKIFGLSEFVLRLPALLAHLLFLFFSYRLVKNFNTSGLIIASFLIINLNPYLLDFFSLSRGYALSLGLMMASIYYLYVFSTKEFKTKHAVMAIVFGGLATTANFVLLNYFVVSFGLMGLLVLTDFMQKQKKDWYKLSSSLALQSLFFLAFLYFLLPVVLKLQDAGALFYGGKNSFWDDTFRTITDRCFYEIGYNYWFQRLAKGFVIFIAIAVTVFVGMKHAKSKINASNSFLGTLVLLLGFCVLANVVQHHVFGTLYLIDRTALYLVVLFNLLFVFFINEFSKEIQQISIVSYLAGIVVVFHFVLAFNLTYVLEWKWDADIKTMVSDLDKIKEIPKRKGFINIAVPLEFDQGINFYRAKDNLVWINTVQRSDFEDRRYDYLFFGPDEFSKVNKDSLEIIKIYPGTNNILAKHKRKPNLTEISFSQQLDFEKSLQNIYHIDENVEYSKGFSYIVNDSVTPDKNAEVLFSADVMTEDFVNSNMYMIIAFGNSKETYLWKKAFVKDHIVRSNEWTSIYFSVFVPKECVAGDELKSYIWNPYGQKLNVRKMEFKWLAKP